MRAEKFTDLRMRDSVSLQWPGRPWKRIKPIRQASSVPKMVLMMIQKALRHSRLLSSYVLGIRDPEETIYRCGHTNAIYFCKAGGSPEPRARLRTEPFRRAGSEARHRYGLREQDRTGGIMRARVQVPVEEKQDDQEDADQNNGDNGQDHYGFVPVTLRFFVAVLLVDLRHWRAHPSLTDLANLNTTILDEHPR
jgi:hypothetical protein